MKKKILIFGPIGDYGGRELETGFIASTLASAYDVSVCSTSNLTNKSQIFNFVNSFEVFTLKERLYKKFFILKVFAYFSFLKNRCKGKISEYVNNALAKKKLGYDNKTSVFLNDLIDVADCVFIVAQLSSNMLNEVITLSKLKNKKVFFRTTGTITNTKFNFITSVDCFCHHSLNNSNALRNYINHQYVLIDQCAYNEDKLLEVPVLTREISKFLVLSRLSPEKGVEQIIDFFLQIYSKTDELFIAGNGPLEFELINKYKGYNNIHFLGFVNEIQMKDLFCKIDCLIIPSPAEAGPLVGIEAMCAGKIIISTDVGAMRERLSNTLNNFWFRYNDYESFKEAFINVKKLKGQQVKDISISLRKKYKTEYSIKTLEKKYINVISNF